jgi:hypothetical protein
MALATRFFVSGLGMVVASMPRIADALGVHFSPQEADLHFAFVAEDRRGEEGVGSCAAMATKPPPAESSPQSGSSTCQLTSS